MSYIFQLTHPCDEQENPKIFNGKFFCWSNARKPHSKKCIQACAKYLTVNNYNKEVSYTEKQGKLFFWAEWEACSQIISCPSKTSSTCLSSPPQYIHKALLKCNNNCNNIPKIPHNSDPLLFADDLNGRIIYSNCKQNKGIHGKRNANIPNSLTLKSLPQNTIIVFGCIDENNKNFNVDCVFVVDYCIHYYVGKDNLLPKEKALPSFFKEIVFDPLNKSYSQKRYKKSSQFFTVYIGKTFDPSNPNDIFSFFPAVTKENCIKNLPLKLTSNNNFQFYLNGKPKRGYWVYQVLKPNTGIKQAWDEIRDQTIKQGLVFGLIAKL